MRKVSRIVLSLLLILAIIVPATVFVSAEPTVNTTPKIEETTKEYYNLKSGLYTKKNVKGPLDNGNYQVTLESYTSDVRLIPSDNQQILDIMCLVDQSNSMLFDDRMSQLKSSLKTVMSSLINDYGAGSKLKINVSIWSFSNVCTKTLSKMMDYRELNSANYKARTSIFKKKNIEDIIDDLVAHAIGGTNTGEAMTRMNEAISDRINSTKNDSIPHSQMLLVFTDGAPSVGTQGFDEAIASDYANTALAQAKSLKDKGVSIYSVGVGNSFYTLPPIAFSKNGLKYIINQDWDNDLKRATLFLNMLSSGWKATTIQSYNWRKDDSWKSAQNDYIVNINPKNPTSYYYVGGVSDANNLSRYIATSILYSMSSRWVSQGSLLGDYSLKDTTSDYFEVVSGTTKIYKVPYDYSNGAYNGDESVDRQHGESKRAWGTPVDITNQISYTETENAVEVLATPANSQVVDVCVTDDLVKTQAEHSGNKLRVTFEIRPKGSFLGGKSVSSNDYNNSGIFKTDSSGNQTAIQNFVQLTSTSGGDTTDKTSPTFNIALLDVRADIAADNIKIGYLYNLESLGQNVSSVVYSDRYDSSIYSMIQDGSGDYSVKNYLTGDKIVYSSESQEIDGETVDVETGPADFVEVRYGQTYADSSATERGVVWNDSLVQFNSVGYKYDKTRGYIGASPILYKYVYLAWSGMTKTSTIISDRFSTFNETGKDASATEVEGIVTEESGMASYFVNGRQAIRQINNGFFVNVFVPNVLVSDAVSSSGITYPVDSEALSNAFDSLNTTTLSDTSISDVLAHSMTGSLTSLAVAQINPDTTADKFVKLKIIGDSVTIDTTSKNAVFVDDAFALSDAAGIKAYVKNFADSDGNTKSKNDAVSDKDKLQLCLSYNALEDKIASLPTDAAFKTTVDEFWAVNQCNTCTESDKITPKFLSYQAQVHISDKNITVYKTGCDLNHINESFVFTVVGFKAKTDGSVDMDTAKVLNNFTIQGNGQRTVAVSASEYKYYCVIEDLNSLTEVYSGWSWDYTDKLTINGTQWKSIEENVFTLDGVSSLTFNNNYDSSNQKLHYASSYACNVMSKDSATAVQP